MGKVRVSSDLEFGPTIAPFMNRMTKFWAQGIQAAPSIHEVGNATPQH
jgi:hypothetical protein